MLRDCGTVLLWVTFRAEMLLKMCSGKEILVLQHRSPVNIFGVLYCLHSVIGKMANLLHFLLMETGKNTA